MTPSRLAAPHGPFPSTVGVRDVERVLRAWSSQAPFCLTRPLVVLGVHRGPDDRKQTAIEAWLRDHEPDPILRRALEGSGYLPSEQASA